MRPARDPCQAGRSASLDLCVLLPCVGQLRTQMSQQDRLAGSMHADNEAAELCGRGDRNDVLHSLTKVFFIGHAGRRKCLVVINSSSESRRATIQLDLQSAGEAQALMAGI